MFKLKQSLVGLGVAALLGSAGTAQAATMPIYSENFDTFNLGGGVTTCTAASGLCVVNRSTNAADNWGGGNSNIFPAFSGDQGSYIADSFEASGTPVPPGGTISDWLLTPTRTIGNGYTFSFVAKGATPDVPLTFPDRLQIRLSTNGTSVNVGTTPTSVGDFGTLLLTINPTLAPGGFPTEWTPFTATVSGLTGLTTGRFAARYFIDNTTTQGNYIGLDDFVISAVPEPGTLAILGLGLGGMMVARRRRTAP